MRTQVVYKITYPNGKIYVGSDVTGTVTYFGSVNDELVAADHTPEQLRDFTVRKQVLWESPTAEPTEVRARERQYIETLQSNNPDIGYNRTPKFRG
ncbi:hypothetical protein C1701_26180 [Actinoalloteichus sp. AHMU CJ021]|uniref:hypothetical protein n=1 Tax=Actinoalloteichus cyanogriseus TaxID=2893586 RepID=UPI0004AB8950|nr:hypothetical protein [Actinoalloteichus caeruleus]AUS81238.1 hypothetical protein C1701_26180 [Actinoalloteichus sp. AHMU CJ021]